MHGFELRGGSYVPVKLVDMVMFDEVGLGLTVWTGVFEGWQAEWLRWCLADGTLLPTAEDVHKRAEEEHERAEKLAARLRALGEDPDALI